MPRTFAPSLNVTVPDGVACELALAATVAVKVTEVPVDEGFRDETSEVVVATWSGALITCVKAVLVLVKNAASPAYVAVIEWLPGPRAEVLNEACPLAIVPLPSTVAPSLKVTVPPGVPVAMPDTFVTVAVKVTDAP